MQRRRTASSSCRLVRPPGSGVPVPGAMPGSTTSTSTERKTASQSSSAMSIGLGQARRRGRGRPPRSSRSYACPARPSSPGSRARASSRAGRSAGSGHPGWRPTRSSRRIGVPCPCSEPNWESPVSAWASKWITETRPQPTCGPRR